MMIFSSAMTVLFMGGLRAFLVFCITISCSTLIPLCVLKLVLDEKLENTNKKLKKVIKGLHE